jgi:protein subunit release factor B
MIGDLYGDVMKEPVFSVTASDCEWKYTRGTGNGGQKKNKTNSACHCIHRLSGAHGYAEDERSQQQNRKLAFQRMANTKEFKEWLRIEFRRRTGQQAVIDDNIDRAMRQIKVEVKNEGLWTEVDKTDPLPDIECT